MDPNKLIELISLVAIVGIEEALAAVRRLVPARPITQEEARRQATG